MYERTAAQTYPCPSQPPTYICRIGLLSLVQAFPNFFPEGHISDYTTVRGPDILRQAVVSGYVTFCQISKYFVNIFFIVDKNGFAGRIWTAGCSFETLA